MLRITREQVKRISVLSRVGLEESEIPELQEQLSRILDNFEVLQQVDTTNVPPTALAIPLHNVLREDEVTDSLPVDVVLANAPSQEADCFKVHAVLE